MRFGLKCFTCGQGFDPTEAHAEIWCDGDNVVTLCASCVLASDLRINFGGCKQDSVRTQAAPSWPSSEHADETYLWDALKRMHRRNDPFRRRRAT